MSRADSRNPCHLLCPPQRFKARVDAAVRQLHACRRAPGFDRIYAPREREALNQEAYAREGIPLNAAILADLREVGGALGINFPASDS